MPKISIVTETMRVGGLDVLFDGLRKQSFKDFELILVDAFAERRHEIVAAKAKEYGLAVTHVEPFENPFPTAAFCRYGNTGLVYAQSELVLFILDYTWCPPDLVERHVRFHTAANPQILVAYACPHVYRELPALAPAFPGYDRQKHDVDTDRYAADVRSGALDSVMWSIFERPFDGDARELPQDKIQGTDPKLKLRQGLNHGWYFHAKNESMRLEPLLDINGWDEALDKTHCYQDTDLADRLSKIGMRWFIDPTLSTQIVNPRGVFPFARYNRPVEANKEYWEGRRLAGYPGAVNTWQLRALRRVLALDQQGLEA